MSRIDLFNGIVLLVSLRGQGKMISYYTGCVEVVVPPKAYQNTINHIIQVLILDLHDITYIHYITIDTQCVSNNNAVFSSFHLTGITY